MRELLREIEMAMLDVDGPPMSDAAYIDHLTLLAPIGRGEREREGWRKRVPALRTHMLWARKGAAQMQLVTAAVAQPGSPRPRSPARLVMPTGKGARLSPQVQ